MADRTADEIAQDYTAMGHSVDLINAIIAGTAMDEDTDAEKKACVLRNVKHLELMKAMKKEDGTTSIWNSESFTAIDKAVTDGTTYVG